MSHVSLLEQSLDSMDDDNDHMVTKQQGDSQAVTRQVQSVRPRATVHTALDVETASGTFIFIRTVVRINNNENDDVPDVMESKL